MITEIESPKLRKLYENEKYRELLDKMITEMENEEGDKKVVELGLKE